MEKGKKQKLQLVADYLESIGELEDGLTAEKVVDRAEIIDDPERPDWIVFAVDRHQGILGAYYNPGQPMEAYITRFQLYAFNPVTKTIELSGENGEPEVHIDYQRVADVQTNVSFEFTRARGGKHLCREQTDNEECLVGNLEEVKVFAESLIEKLNFSGVHDELSEFLEDDAIQEIVEKLKSAFKKRAVEKAEIAWESYNEGIKLRLV